jgi:5-formaminoimidazole-4-carboxamide-1-beta-D-ribofuranosyl 5'-monophosphate synthetase
VKKPIKINLNAPRMRKAQFSTIVFTKELYQRFKEKHPEHKEITWKEFKDRWAEITETIRTEAVYNPSGVKLAFYLGELKYQFYHISTNRWIEIQQFQMMNQENKLCKPDNKR